MNIESLWDEHQKAPFPAVCRGRDLAGIDFVMLDADIAGCVSTFLKARKSLDLWRTAVLGVCYRDVTYVLATLPAECQSYFARLEQMARLVLDDVREQARAK